MTLVRRRKMLTGKLWKAGALVRWASKKNRREIKLYTNLKMLSLDKPVLRNVTKCQESTHEHKQRTGASRQAVCLPNKE